MSSKPKYPGLAIVLGATLGVIFGVLAGNMGAWLAVGVAVGVAIGAAWKKKTPECPHCVAVHRSHADMQRRQS